MWPMVFCLYVEVLSFIFEQKRKDVMKGASKEIETTAIKEGNITIKSKKQLSQIIDTTLLKCYLLVHNAHVYIVEIDKISVLHRHNSSERANLYLMYSECISILSTF